MKLIITESKINDLIRKYLYKDYMPDAFFRGVFINTPEAPSFFLILKPLRLDVSFLRKRLISMGNMILRLNTRICVHTTVNGTLTIICTT